MVHSRNRDATGECYGIPYAKIRPEDCIIKDYSKADSWQLDAGAERLDEALKIKFNIMVPEKLESMKVKDLVVIVTNGSKS